MISVEPTEDEKSRLMDVAEKAMAEIKEEIELIDGRIKPALLGSASRDTWLREEKDLDIFLIFPLEYEKRQLEEIVTGIGNKVLKDITKRYAEHPYVRGKYEDFDIEIVPCYGVDSPPNLKSAVDRTPFHAAFVGEHVRGKENEVRLLKQFLKGIGCYGAEARVEGFSGYLCELLVIKYGSFEKVLKSAREWEHGNVIWIDKATNNENIKKFPEALVFIDPVDENRNVASALSATKLSEFIFACGKYLEDPRDEFFFPLKRRASREEVIQKFEKRQTDAIAVVFDTPDLIDDILYPQLRRAAGTIKKQLLGLEFPVLGIDFFIKEETCIFIELESARIPKMRLHLGPHVNTSHEERFLSKYKEFDEKLTEPFISGSRWAIFLKRKYTGAKDFLHAYLSQPHLEKNGMPKYIAKSITEGFEIKEGKDAMMDDFLDGLLDYFDPIFPWDSQ
jgi:tRNA nucleotidyltransferase (CCA-adding enzyme)